MVGNRINVAFFFFIITMAGGASGIYYLGAKKINVLPNKKLLRNVSPNPLYLQFTHHLEDRIAR